MKKNKKIILYRLLSILLLCSITMGSIIMPTDTYSAYTDSEAKSRMVALGRARKSDRGIGLGEKYYPLSGGNYALFCQVDDVTYVSTRGRGYFYSTITVPQCGTGGSYYVICDRYIADGFKFSYAQQQYPSYSSHISSLNNYRGGLFDGYEVAALDHESSGTPYCSGGYWYTTCRHCGAAIKGSPITYNVQYLDTHSSGQSSSGTMANTTHTYNTAANLRANAFVKPGFKFAGWATTADGPVVYADGASVKNLTATGNAVVSLYAVWEPDYFNIIYHINDGDTLDGGTAETITKRTKYGTALDLSVKATKDKYKHIGWALAPNSNFIIEGNGILVFGAEERYEDYLDGDKLHLYALYSVDVSDIWKVFIDIWNISDKAGTKATYEMNKIETLDGGYTYAYSDDLTSSLKNKNVTDIKYSIYAIDNAKNVGTISGPVPDLEKYYQQTVIHKVWDIDEECYIEHNRTIDSVQGDSTYTPQPLDSLLQWHEVEVLPQAYKVTGEKTIEIKYKPKEITVNLDACGGKASKDTISVYMNTLYGQLPTAKREGYTFAGWYTEKDKGGVRIVPTKEYPYPSTYPNEGPLTLYAGWDINSYNTEYNFEYNGGNTMETIKEEDLSYEYGEEINLDYEATKYEWDFIGWNTNPDATTALTSIKVGAKPITLFAIYKKDIDFTFIEMGDKITQIGTTIYNREKQGTVFSPVISPYEEWQPKGWINSVLADGTVKTTGGGKVSASVDTIFHAVYEKDILVDYVTNHPEVTFGTEKGHVFYNTGEESQKYEVFLREIDKQNRYSFLYWTDGKERYAPGDKVEVIDSTTFTAIWDEYPELFVEERYFTLEQANEGFITKEVLLEGATARDREDDVAGLPVSITIEGYYADEFTSLSNSADITIVFVATDSYGNQTKRNITIHVVRSIVGSDTSVMTTRFIDKEFYNTSDETVYVDESNGGLRNESIWKNDTSYAATLTYALSNEKTNKEYVDVTYGGKTSQVAVPSSGTWNHCYASYTYTASEIEDIKSYVIENGFGKYKDPNATATYINTFMQE